MSAVPEHGALLLVEDDPTFARVLARALGRRGFDVVTAASAAAALEHAARVLPRYAVVDLKLGADSGLDLIPALRARLPSMRIVLLTGYASIATAVEAIKRGANDYLAKSVDTDTIVRTLIGVSEESDVSGDAPGAASMPLPLRRLEWEHVQRVLLECDGNVSEAARRLGMHRRTLQRKLEKHPVQERPASI